MQHRIAPWVLGAVLALPALGRTDDSQSDTVKPEDVKTWTATIDGQQYEVRPATATDDGDTGLFRLSSAYTLPKGKVSFSLYRDNIDRDPKDLDFTVLGLSFAAGATDKLEVFGDAGLQNRLRTKGASQSGFFNDLPFAGTDASNPHWQTGFGDIKVGAKYAFLDDYRKDAVGLAVKAYAKLPTADSTLGLGTGKPSFGADLILSKTLNRQADIHASVGYQINEDPDTVNIGNAFKWGLGLNVPACRILQLQAEVTGLAYGTADFPQTNPVDLVAGVVLYLKPGIFIRPAFSYALNKNGGGDGNGLPARSGRLLSIGYHPGTPCCQVAAPPPPPPPPPANRPPTVSVTCDTPVAPGVVSRCRATASDPDGDPLTYAWTSGGGKIVGSGANANLDTGGINPSDCVPVTVKVDDGRGGTADATTQVCIKAAERKQAQTLCTSSGFPRNLDRLNNVDKACLDDVASRLREDARARLVVIGYADASERYPDVIARKRAEAIKSYLVKERGVDESRITAKGAGATKPVDTGASVAARAKNRRVEVILVPEGAMVPEDDD